MEEEIVGAGGGGDFETGPPFIMDIINAVVQYNFVFILLIELK